MNTPQVFIWTEAFNCGELLKPMLSSFLAHHNIEINVYGYKSDLDLISDLKFEQIKKHDLSEFGAEFEEVLKRSYGNGHRGTAVFWSKIITTRPEKFLVHLDADTIFVGECLTKLIQKLSQDNFSIVGSRRPYKFRNYRKKGLDGFLLDFRPDTVNTDCFGFNREMILRFPEFWLRRKVQGKRCSLLPVVDFFDPISFEILRKSGKVFYLDSDNSQPKGLPIYTSDFHGSRISFAAVGSGINFYKNAKTVSSPGYISFALQSFSLYSKWILGVDLGIPTLHSPDLEERLARLDKELWTLT